jgi:hypothetical protein
VLGLGCREKAMRISDSGFRGDEEERKKEGGMRN